MVRPTIDTEPGTSWVAVVAVAPSGDESGDEPSRPPSVVTGMPVEASADASGGGEVLPPRPPAPPLPASFVPWLPPVEASTEKGGGVVVPGGAASLALPPLPPVPGCPPVAPSGVASPPDES
ncbi:MAG TPA: hypothetical protein VH062_09625 [Polyangiaceae bacterium]|nr:hypothetical protein [Polyangiaceae bacterium]